VKEELLPRFGANNRVIIVHKGCGAEEGEATITTYGHGSTISTFVPDYYWQKGGPWANTPHDGSEQVEMTTLDALIDLYGVPDFIKVDVEGYEYEVLQGLHQFAPLSFEFHPVFALRASLCMAHILEIEPEAEFNYTEGESLKYASPEWLDRDMMRSAISDLFVAHGTNYFGNIYVRKASDAE
jgi:FkbM family methyltransferase